MMDDGSVHHGGVRHHGGHGYHSGVGISLGGGEGGEHEQLQWIKVRGLVGFDGNHRRLHVPGTQNNKSLYIYFT